MSIVLYGYWRSSAAYRVRIALSLKSLSYQTMHVSLVDGGQYSTEFLDINAQGLVPVLVDNNVRISQSMAIMEYLDEVYAETRLLPVDALGRARVRQIAQTIACDIHPLCNLRVLGYLKDRFRVAEQEKLDWYRHWVSQGLTALEKFVSQTYGEFCVGDEPSLADCCLIPQLYNAERFSVPNGNWPVLCDIAERCYQHPAFIEAHPDNNQSG